tara:strand:+ start:3046 stop:3441 length:396 start_codon:yes stop_codon:yes gene_type:complete
MKPFDYLNAVNFNKTNIIEDSDNPKLAEGLYPPFLVNRGLSYFTDTILFANEMNIRHHCDHKLQFEFFLNTIRKRKRFSKWFKKEQDANLDIIMSHYDYSYEKAKQVVTLFSEQQLQQLRDMRFEGGLNGG